MNAWYLTRTFCWPYSTSRLHQNVHNKHKLDKNNNNNNNKHFGDNLMMTIMIIMNNNEY